MLIDCSYFTVGPRHILNATLGSTPRPNAIEVNRAIEAYIADLQEPYLVKMLGRTIGNKVNTYLVCQDDGDAVKNDHYDAVCSRLRESFADYVFFHILGASNVQATLTGPVRLKCANEYIAPIGRQVMVWNNMVDRNRKFAQWCTTPENALGGIVTDVEMTTKVNTFNL